MEQLYAGDQKKEFDSLFAAPGARYRDTPFWAWNCKLKLDQLRRQIDVFQEMGMGGFHMHARTGLGTPYLGPEFLEAVRGCVDHAKKREMLAWLYDEDRWPSGSAGGIVTRDPKMRGRRLVLTANRRSEPVDSALDDSGKLLACYSIRFGADDTLAGYRRIGEEEPAEEGAEKFYLYRLVGGNDPWFNDEAYVDTLNPAAIRRFVEVTHEAYFKAVGDEFDKTIPAIFTDEPQFSRKTALRFAREKRDVVLPYTDDLPESYRAAYHADFFETLPEIVWELPEGKFSLARYRFHDHVAERFASAFADTIGDWCRAHNLRSSGHLMEEPTLESQTHSLGDAMRSYRSFQLPGIDMLCDWTEYTTAKQAQSASRQFGCGGVLSELYGVTDWDFNFLGHKGQGDWQAALGVTVRVPHLSWVSMAGEAKRDYPASISYQSPWHEKYHLITDHFARVNAAMTRGRARVRVGVIHPVESYWLIYGPQDQTARLRQEAEESFRNLTEWLLMGTVDFDFISESLLPEQCPVQLGRNLIVGEMAYEAVIVPPTLTLRTTTLERLEKFQAAGGRLIFAGRVAEHVDAQPSERARNLAEKSQRIEFSRAALLAAVEPERDLSVVNRDTGYPASGVLYQMRQEGRQRYLFIANTERLANIFPGRLILSGEWQLEFCDTATGAITPVAAEVRNGRTVFEYDFNPHGHLLLRLTPSASSTGAKLRQPPRTDEGIEAATVARIAGDRIPVSLDEPNVLVLDQAEWKLEEDGGWQPREEILRLDDKVRDRLGMRRRGGHIVQPWAQKPSEQVFGRLLLRYEIVCDVPVAAPELALEPMEEMELFLDGAPLPFSDCGWWTDEAVRRTALPALAAGRHELIVKVPMRNRVNPEAMFLLGDFGVALAGDRARLTAPVRSLSWGDIGPQGLPFYGGNVVYHCGFETDREQELALRLPSRITQVPQDLHGNYLLREVRIAAFRGTLVGVELDGKPVGDIAFAPFQCELGRVPAGKHRLDLKLYGSRINCFGALHLSYRIPWMGPGAWRTTRDMFSYDYQLQPIGITVSPRLLNDGE